MTDENELGRLASDFKDYVKLQVEILRLELVQKASKFAAKLASVLVLVVVAVFMIFAITLSAGFYLGELLESHALGFLLLGGVYLLVFLLLVFFGDRVIQAPVRDKIIRAFLGEDKEER